MEDALRWGVEHIFSRQHYITQPTQHTDAATLGPSRPTSAAAAASLHSRGDTKMEDALSPRSPSHPAPEAGTAAAESTPSPRGKTKTPSASPEPSMKSPFGSPEQQQPKSHSKPLATTNSSVFQPVYTDRVVKKVLQWSVAHTRQAKAGGHPRSDGEDKVGAEIGVGLGAQSLGEVLGPGWGCVKLHEWNQGQLDDEAQADEGGRLYVTIHYILLDTQYTVIPYYTVCDVFHWSV